MRVEAVRLIRQPLLLESKGKIIVVFPEVLVMIHSEIWFESDKYLERGVSRYVRLHIKCEEKRTVKNEQLDNHGSFLLR